MSDSVERRGAYLAIATFVGVLSATQARLNGSLGVAIASGVHAAVVSFGVGLGLFVLITFASTRARLGLRGVITAVHSRKMPFWALLGGVLGAVFVLSQSASVGTIGVAMFMTCMVLGQLMGSLLIDATGILGAPRKQVTLMRVIGAVLTAGAVALIGWGSEIGVAELPLMAGALFAGIAVSLQMAVTGTVNLHAGEPVAPGTINFIVGFVVLGVAALLAQAFGLVDARPLPPLSEWWLYLGGACGVAYLLVVAAVVRKIGVFLLTLAVVAGQLVGALLWDLLAGHFSALVLIGVPLAFAGILVANVGSLGRSR